jgi:ABC-2 type transport system ATP-binding protein
MADGTTILLTTQDLEEADRLAYWIVVIDTGRVVEQGPAG